MHTLARKCKTTRVGKREKLCKDEITNSKFFGRFDLNTGFKNCLLIWLWNVSNFVCHSSLWRISVVYRFFSRVLFFSLCISLLSNFCLLYCYYYRRIIGLALNLWFSRENVESESAHFVWTESHHSKNASFG